MKKLFLCGFLLYLLLPLNLMAATEGEKRAAIDDGLAYLATTQNPDGSFDGGGIEYRLSQTGSALLAFLEEKPNWGTNAAAYQAAVDNGLNYLFSNASVVAIGPQPAGNPDSDGNGVGVEFNSGFFTRDTYVTGIVLPAIASTGTPNAVVTTGPLSGWTYKEVVQNTLDYFAWGQTEGASPGPRGGWRYYANSGDSDQSTTQWPVIAGLFATEMGVSYPQFVKDELALWTDYIQNFPGPGNAGYDRPDRPLGEMNETGALLLMQDYVGLPTGDPRVQAALNFINTNWTDGASSGLGNSVWDGNFGHPYAMWAIYKGLEATIGLDDTTTITNLNPDPGDVDNPNHPYNWWEDYNEYLVSTQLADGSWGSFSSNWPTALATPWYINILAGTLVPESEPISEPIPEPATLLLVGSGLLGMGVFARRKKKK